MIAFQHAVTVGATVLPVQGGRFVRPCDRSTYTYMSSGRSPAQLTSPCFGPLGYRPETKPRSASSGAGQTAHAFVSPFGEKRDSSRALHPPSAARYFVGGIPPPRLARVLWRITRTVAAPFPCARSSHMRRLPDLPLRRVSFRSICARRRSASSLSFLQAQIRF